MLQQECKSAFIVCKQPHSALAVPDFERICLVGAFLMRPLNFENNTLPGAVCGSNIRDIRTSVGFAKAARTMASADLWLARFAIKTLRREQREAIAEAGES